MYNRVVKDLTGTQLTGTPLDHLLTTAKVRHYPRGQIILYEGENPTEAFVVKSGAVKIYDIDEDGNEKILHIVKTPGIFPTIFLFGAVGITNTFYTTVSDSDLYVLSRADFEARLESDPKLANYCIRWFAGEVSEILRRMSSLEKTSTRDKLIATLGYLVRQHADDQKGGWKRVRFPISHQLLADMIGVTRESTTMVMKDLHKEKIVRTPKLGILDINTLLVQD